MWQRLVGALAVALVAISASIVGTAAAPAQALSGADFDPGAIISDANFYNGSAMSEAEIQRFLESAVGGRCDNANCLAAYRTATPTRTWSFGTCSTYHGAANESAARIIFKVQQACNLSAKVILVTLQKEQSLVTNRAPSDGVMRKAMGYGCPDTSSCDSTYYGFFNQIFAAGRQLTWYTNPAGSFTSIKVGQVNQVRYHPNAACGTKGVHIKNRATAALYYYTPYTPNAAALANIGGTGDGCSAYGNRNFWVFYNNWFGPTTMPGANEITALWNATGGASGVLGAATSGFITIAEHGGGLGQAFANGSIYWTSATGAQYVIGPIKDYYFARRGAAGPLRYPTSSTQQITAQGGGAGQVFQGGSVYTSGFGTFRVDVPIRDTYWAYAGAAGPLGWPTAELSTSTVKGGGSGQSFQAGAIYSSRSGTWAVLGFERYYASRGNATGALGWPASNPIAMSGGTGQAFSDGSVYQRAGGDAYSVLGAMRSYYFSFGGATGSFGWPIAEQECSGNVCTQRFQNAILRTAPEGASWSSPQIDEAYTAAGGAGKLGAPTSGYLFVREGIGGVARAYQNGSVYSSSSGTFAVSGAIRTRYFASGGAAGPLGWPTGAETCGLAGGGCSQAFAGGTVFSMPGDVARVTTAQFFEAYAAAGGPAGVLGASTSDSIVIPQNGGGHGQAFINGSLFAKNGGAAQAVTGDIRTAYFSRGGAAGHLGFPATAMACSGAGGPCTQGFDFGSIRWTAQGGAVIY
ncbi:LGFP repeat-containing protein [Agromyces silvae]|uniref:LGFP repeat-containing protein n=1 Tax=Agromyces silvae TaxID=3388266 RepID=UPI00280BD5D5|nr:hypothetical protein [Agromyces protaetiae]